MVQELGTKTDIKGIRDGLLISYAGGDFPAWYDNLAVQLAEKQSFLRGSRVTLATGDQRLVYHQLVEIRNLLRDHELELWAVLAEVPTTREAARRLALATRLPGSNTDLEGNSLDHAPAAAEHLEQEVDQAANGLLLRETIRSGRSIYHDGHVIIVGDVNPGAEVIAGGDVIVWGKVRGLVHAGALGDTDAVICALELIPTQLRIADQIAISPHDQHRPAAPEKVSIRDGQLIAEAWSRK